MDLAIFDLDNTLISGDSDYLWGKYLVSRGLVDADEYERANQQFYDDYQDGTLDIYAFLKFSFEPLSNHKLETLLEIRNHFLNECIWPIITSQSRKLIQQHRDQGHYLLIITATNLFITEPIAKELGVDSIIATEAQIVNGQYTGEVEGIPCFKEGKVKRLNNWLESTSHNLDNSWFYSDSHNDLPLLELVTYPVAVDPDEKLNQHADSNNWPIISLRSSTK